MLLTIHAERSGWVVVGIRSTSEASLRSGLDGPIRDWTASRRQARITIVDDDSELRRLLADALRGIHRVSDMAAPASMIPIAESEPDVLIVRLESSTATALTGLQVAALARRHRLLMTVPIIILTADTRRLHDRAFLTALTDVHVVPMPFDLATIQAVVSSVMRGIRAQRPPARSEFARDPHAWFAWIGAEIPKASWATVRPSVQPASWANARGGRWRIVQTAGGIEVRPDLVSPFIQYNDAAKVTAIGLRECVEVELTSRSGRWVGRFPRDAFDIAALGRAMLDECELPHDNLRRLFPRR